MAKFLAAVKHYEFYHKEWTFIQLEGSSKNCAFVEAAVKGFQRSDVQFVDVLKQVNDGDCLVVARVYPSGKHEILEMLNARLIVDENMVER